MVDRIAGFLEVSTSVVWALGALLLLQLAVQVWALVDLVRRPAVRFEKKWIWAAVIIVLGNSFIGPILYAAVGRSVPQPADVVATEPPAADGDRTSRAVDTLYGGDDGR